MGEVLLSDALTAKHGPAKHKLLYYPKKPMFRIRHPYEAIGPYTGKLCTHVHETECGCAIPYEERRARAFVRKRQYNDCYDFDDVNGAAYYNLDLVKLLLVYGEMDMVLRVCSLPGVDLKTWHRMGSCSCVVRENLFPPVYRRLPDSFSPLH